MQLPWHSRLITMAGTNIHAEMHQASPGNLQAVEDYLPEVSSDPVVAAIQLSPGTRGAGECLVGLGVANATDKTLGLVEFEDNELFTNLETLLIHLSVKECVLPYSKSGEHELYAKRLLEVCELANIVVTRIDPKWFKMPEVGKAEQLFTKELGGNAAIEEVMSNQPLGAAGLGALITYLDLFADISVHRTFKFVQPRPAAFMRLDSHAVLALDLEGEGARKPSHLYGLLNRTMTGPGSRLLRSWLRQPLASRADIEIRLDCVESLVQNSEFREAIRVFLGHLPDLGRLSKKLIRSKASLQDLVLLYQMVLRMPELIPSIAEIAPLNSRYGEDLTLAESSLGPFLQMIEDTIDLEAIENHHFHIRPGVNAELNQLKESIEELENEIRPETIKVARELGLELNKALKVENNSQYGYHLRVSRNVCIGTRFPHIFTKTGQVIELIVGRINGFSISHCRIQICCDPRNTLN
jgi:DNA mismatch repair protein MSH2